MKTQLEIAVQLDISQSHVSHIISRLGLKPSGIASRGRHLYDNETVKIIAAHYNEHKKGNHKD